MTVYHSIRSSQGDDLVATGTGKNFNGRSDGREVIDSMDDTDCQGAGVRGTIVEICGGPLMVKNHPQRDRERGRKGPDPHCPAP